MITDNNKFKKWSLTLFFFIINIKFMNLWYMIYIIRSNYLYRFIISITAGKYVKICIILILLGFILFSFLFDECDFILYAPIYNCIIIGN